MSNDNRIESQLGESIVLVNEEVHRLRFMPVVRASSVRSEPLSSDEGNIVYAEGRDYVIDYEQGTIRRTADSAIPNWANHPLYGKADFDHRLYECSNRRYTVWIDYEYEAGGNARNFDRFPGQRRLERVLDKLAHRRPFRYVVLGDSISAGGEASRDAFAFYRRFADELRTVAPEADIDVINQSIGGENSAAGLERLDNDVIRLKPDLVSIGYGMNDQNRDGVTGNQVPPKTFDRNLRNMVSRIQEQTDAEIILITPCIPNPLWMHSSGELAVYAHVIRGIGEQLGVCVADVHSRWLAELRAGKTHESLLLNNINHPNDYGHRIYYEAFRRLIIE